MFNPKDRVRIIRLICDKTGEEIFDHPLLGQTGSVVATKNHHVLISRDIDGRFDSFKEIELEFVAERKIKVVLKRKPHV